MSDAAGNSISLSTRKKIFADLVALQDEGLDTPLTRQLIAKRFNVGASEVQRIEEEGLREEWPPL